VTTERGRARTANRLLAHTLLLVFMLAATGPIAAAQQSEIQRLLSDMDRIFGTRSSFGGGWREFRDGFGGRIEYPAIFDLSYEQGFDTIHARGSNVRFSMSAWEMPERRAIGELLEDAVFVWRGRGSGFAITQRREDANGFVLAGTDRGQRRVFFHRLLVSGDGRRIHQFVISYRDEQRPMLDPIVVRMSASFRVPQN